jgi:acylphosphatase
MSQAEGERRRSVRVRIEGRVQGVGYRYWTEGRAMELGLAGWVRNRRDGSVEAVFAGPADGVAELLHWCREGPRGARVAAVIVLEEDCEAGQDFEVLPTE